VQELLRVADRFQAGGLYEHCLAEFGRVLTVEMAIQHLVWAHAHAPEGAREVAMEYVVGNGRAIQVGSPASQVCLCVCVCLRDYACVCACIRVCTGVRTSMRMHGRAHVHACSRIRAVCPSCGLALMYPRCVCVGCACGGASVAARGGSCLLLRPQVYLVASRAIVHAGREERGSWCAQADL
jgi:hypothetical protein